MSNTKAGAAQDSDACPCEGRALDKLVHPAILIVLAQGPLHGYKLAERLGEMPICGGRKPDVSGVYRFLKAMEKSGHVVGSRRPSENGPARKCFQITPAGEECLARWVETLERYRRQINALLKTARKALA